MTNTITLTDEQMSDLKAGNSIIIEPPTPKKIELEGGDWYVCPNGVTTYFPSEPLTCSFGLERRAASLAETASKQMRRFNRMLAYIDERTEEGEKRKCHAQFMKDKWILGMDSPTDTPSLEIKPYGTYEVIQRLCADLNSGAFDLDGE